MSDLAAIDTSSLRGKGIVTLLVLSALILAWFGGRWQVGHMFATLTRPDANGAYSLAQLAARWAAGDPAALALRAATVDDPAADERVDALPIYERAVRIGPNDFRWRLALAGALEDEGRFVDAESQFRKALELAPNYSESHWELGNFLLRRGREADAIAELRYAARGDLSYREQFFSLLWDRSGKDERKLVAAHGDEPELAQYLPFFFASRGQADAAVRAWQALSRETRDVNATTAKSIAQALFMQRHYAQSLTFAKEIGIAVEPSVITNNSFEQVLESQDEPNFGWRMGKPEPKIEIAEDTRVSHDGNRSLRLAFRAFNRGTFANPLQTVVVEPGKRYRLRYWVRTENIRGAGAPLITIQDGADDHVIVQSAPMQQGTNDWKAIAIDFSASDKTNGIIISFGRAYCGEDCPLSGTVWFDDLRIERL